MQLLLLGTWGFGAVLFVAALYECLPLPGVFGVLLKSL